MSAKVEKLRADVLAPAVKAGDGERAVKVPESRLVIRDLLDVMERVERAGPPRWLIEGVWPWDAYGVFGAGDKSGKTWAIGDLAVSVAAGAQWLGRFPCEQGPVLLFLGEGGERNFLRRLEAIAQHRGVAMADLMEPLRVCFTAPHLRSADDLQTVARELDAHPARCVLLDPLYLAAAGAKGSDLYAMAEVLGGLQVLCQQAGAALVLSTHWNKTGEGSGPDRFTGVGPGAWGRVLGSAAVERRTSDAEGASLVQLRWQFSGGEIPDTTFRMLRRVRAVDPNDLGSPLRYSVEVTDEGAPERSDDLSPAQRRVLAVLRGEQLLSRSQIGDRIAEDGSGPPLKARTIQDALAVLEQRAEVQGTDQALGAARYWSGVES